MEDEFTFTASVAGIDDGSDVGAEEKFLEQLVTVAVVALVDADLNGFRRLAAVEGFGQNGEVLKRPALVTFVEVLRIL